MRRTFAALLLVALLASSCAPQGRAEDDVPAVAWTDEADALRILRERAAEMKMLTAEGAITLTRPDGESVRLDLAMVSRSPDHLRLRAWKLGRAVFDLTLTPRGLWLLTLDDPSLKEKVRTGGLDAARLAQTWHLFSGGLFERDDLTVDTSNSTLTISAPVDGQRIVCTVDRRTLTPTRYQVIDPRHGAERFSLRPSRYRMTGGIPFPRRYDATSAGGSIRIDLREVELNGELAPAAFTPPRRAEKIEATTP